jgi:hypothetical protein
LDNAYAQKAKIDEAMKVKDAAEQAQLELERQQTLIADELQNVRGQLQKQSERAQAAEQQFNFWDKACRCLVKFASPLMNLGTLIWKLLSADEGGAAGCHC